MAGESQCTSKINISVSAEHKMKVKGLHRTFVRTAFESGNWFSDPLDSSVYHVRFHGHDTICRFRNKALFVITVNTNVPKTHNMKPISSPYIARDNADTSGNWRRRSYDRSKEKVFNDVLQIAERIINEHQSRKWVGQSLHIAT